MAGDLGGIAARGARYGFPGWPQETPRKNGATKIDYLAKDEAATKAREFLSHGKTPAEIAGRLFCLVAMARYANEQDAVANSNRSFYELRVGAGLPYSGEVIDLIDKVCAERLPDLLTKHVRDTRTKARKEEQRRERERQQALRRLDGVEERLGQMSPEEREQVLADAETAHGPYSTERWRLADLIREADNPDHTDGSKPVEPKSGPPEAADDGNPADDSLAQAA